MQRDSIARLVIQTRVLLAIQGLRKDLDVPVCVRERSEQLNLHPSFFFPSPSAGMPHPEELLLPPSHPFCPPVQRSSQVEKDLGRGVAVSQRREKSVGMSACILYSRDGEPRARMPEVTRRDPSLWARAVSTCSSLPGSGARMRAGQLLFRFTVLPCV